MAIDVVVQVRPILEKFDYNPKFIKPVMRKIGALVRKDSRIKMLVRSVNQKAGGRYPGVLTGSMRRSITARVSRSGYSVGIMYDSTERTDKRGFYPAFLLYGVRGRIKPRNNPITDTIGERREEIVSILTDIIESAIAIKPMDMR